MIVEVWRGPLLEATAGEHSGSSRRGGGQNRERAGGCPDHGASAWHVL